MHRTARSASQRRRPRPLLVVGVAVLAGGVLTACGDAQPGVAASIDGLQAGLFRLELTGQASTARSKPSGTSAPTTTIPPKVGPKKPR